MGNSQKQKEIIRDLLGFRNLEAKVEKAITIGQQLIEAKRQVKEELGPGQWITFIQDNFGESRMRTCQNYMKLAKTPIHRSYYNLGTERLIYKISQGKDLSSQMSSRKCNKKIDSNELLKITKEIIVNKTRPKMRQICDAINIQENGSQFTTDGLMSVFSLKDKVNIGTVRQVLAASIRTGYLTSNPVKSPGRGKRVEYTKLHDIPEEDMWKLSSYRTSKRKEEEKKKKKVTPISSIDSESNPEGLTVTTSFDTLKEMEGLIKSQHKRITELKIKQAELLDENTTLSTQLRVLVDEKEIREKTFGHYKFDGSKFKDNLS